MNGPTIYRIWVAETIDDRWSAWFDGLAISPAVGGGTHLTGPIIDQADLFGKLLKIRDLGLTLCGVERLK